MNVIVRLEFEHAYLREKEREKERGVHNDFWYCTSCRSLSSPINPIDCRNFLSTLVLVFELFLSHSSRITFSETSIDN